MSDDDQSLQPRLDHWQHTVHQSYFWPTYNRIPRQKIFNLKPKEETEMNSNLDFTSLNVSQA